MTLPNQSFTVYVVGSNKSTSQVVCQERHLAMLEISDLLDQYDEVKISLKVEHMTKSEWDGLSEIEEE